MPNYKISGSVGENAKISIFAEGNYIGYALVNAGSYEIVFEYSSLVPIGIEAEDVDGRAVAYGQVIPISTSDPVNVITDYTKINSLYNRLTEERATNLDDIPSTLSGVLNVTDNLNITSNNVDTILSDLGGVAGDVATVSEDLGAVSGNVNILLINSNTTLSGINTTSDKIDAVLVDTNNVSSDISSLLGDMSTVLSTTNSTSGDVDTLLTNSNTTISGINSTSTKVDTILSTTNTTATNVNATLSGVNSINSSLNYAGLGTRPIGTPIPILDSKSYLQVIGDEHYLKTGILMSYDSNYSHLVPDYMPLTFCKTPEGLVNHSNALSGVLYNSPNYYFIFSGGIYYETTWGGTFNAAEAPVTNNFDSAMFGTTLWTSGNVNTDYGLFKTLVSSGNATKLKTGTANTGCIAVNASGTLGVFATTTQAALGQICTGGTADAVSDRTPSGGASNAYVSYAFWSNLASAFVYITEDGYIYTTTNGYTLTQRHSLGTTVVRDIGSKTRVASSSTSTIIVRGNELIRTTNGTSYSVTQLTSSLTGYDYFNLPKRISYINGVYYLYAYYTTAGSSPDVNSGTLYSVDDGLTWKRCPTAICDFAGTSNYVLSPHLLFTVNNKFALFHCYSSSTKVLVEFTSNLYTPNYIGDVNARTSNTYPLYIKIK